MSNRKKKYMMYPISPEISEVGGYMARFVSDGYTVDANKEILPGVLDAGGWKISLGSAQDLVSSYLKTCANHTATTGETVNIANIMTTLLSIRGSYEKRKSTAKRENVRVVVRLQEDMRPKVSFAMSNVLEGKILTLQSVTSVGCEPGFVRQSSIATINGLNLEMLEGDTVTATMKGPGGDEQTVPCSFASLGSTRLDVTIPDVFNAAAYAGQKIVFEITNRCGDPEQPQDVDSITATLLASEGGDTPEPEPTPTGPTVAAINDGTFHSGGGNVVTGVNMRFADEYPGNHVVIKDEMGDDMEAMISTDDEVPVTESRFGLNIDEGTPLIDGEPYTFEFSMLDADGQPVTVTQSARWRAS